MELTPQDIRDVRFREKLRGYHPEDVDVFVSNVAATVESLRRRLDELVTQGGSPAAVAPADTAVASDVEDQLRRTLVLAQRTADMAVREAQEEAARLLADAEAQRQQIVDEVESLRARMVDDAQAEVEAERDRLYGERDALQRDIAALQGYLAQERERLRIYFTDQLKRVEDGVPGVESPPAVEAAAREVPDDAPVADGAAADGPAEPVVAPVDDAMPAPFDGADDDEEDQFLAELRRAVTDTEPLGPRDEDEAAPRPADSSLDIFDDDDGGGRFLRRRR